MDACWVYIAAWLVSSVFLSPVSSFPVPSPLSLFALALGGYLCASFLLDRGSTVALRAWTIGLGVGAGVLASALHFPFYGAPFRTIWVMVLGFTFIASFGMWLFGAWRGVERPTFQDVYLAFRLGLSVMSAILLLATLVAREQIDSFWRELSGPALLFFGLGLVALALANREMVRQETHANRMASWGLLVPATVGVVLALALGGQALGGQDVVGQVQGLVVGVLALVVLVVYGILYVVMWPFQFLTINFMDWRLPDTPNPSTTPSPQNDLQRQLIEWERWHPFKTPIEIQTAVLIAGVVAATVLIVLAVRGLLRRTHLRQRATADEEHVSFGSWALLLAQLKGWLKALLARFRRQPPTPASPPAEDDLAALAGRPGMEGTLTVRQIYAQLLRQARSAGYPRLVHQTPGEYLGVLAGVLPELGPDLEMITAAYLQARYSHHPMSPASVDEANYAWRRVVERAFTPQA